MTLLHTGSTTVVLSQITQFCSNKHSRMLAQTKPKTKRTRQNKLTCEHALLHGNKRALRRSRQHHRVAHVIDSSNERTMTHLHLITSYQPMSNTLRIARHQCNHVVFKSNTLCSTVESSTTPSCLKKNRSFLCVCVCLKKNTHTRLLSFLRPDGQRLTRSKHCI